MVISDRIAVPRVAASPGLRVAQGEPVCLFVPPSACIPLAEEEA